MSEQLDSAIRNLIEEIKLEAIELEPLKAGADHGQPKVDCQESDLSSKSDPSIDVLNEFAIRWWGSDLDATLAEALEDGAMADFLRDALARWGEANAALKERCQGLQEQLQELQDTYYDWQDFYDLQELREAETEE